MIILLIPSMMFARTLVLCYHAFSNGPVVNTSIRPEYFRNHIRELRREGFKILTLKESIPIFKAGDKSDSLYAIITFDDGWESVYKYGFPIIQEEEVPVTLFIFPRVISKRPGYLSWEQVREMVASGLVELGSHGLSHVPLDCSTFPRRLHCSWFLSTELQFSKEIIGMNTGKAVFAIAFPYGVHNELTDEFVKKYDYILAFTVDNPIVSGYRGRFRIPRLVIGRKDKSIMDYIRRFKNKQ